MVLHILENMEENLNLKNKMTKSDKLLEEYIEANKNKTNCDIEDIMQDSDFLLELWKKKEISKDF